MSLRCLAVLTAAGSGTRLGCQGPKALVRVAGSEMVLRAVRGLADGGVDGIVVTAPDDFLEEFRALFQDSVAACRYDGHVHEIPVRVVAGSPLSRQASVALGLEGVKDLCGEYGETLDDDCVILIHDAARCLTPSSVIASVIHAVNEGHDAVIPAIAVTDTLKRIDPLRDASAPRPVLDTVDRSSLVAVQTPQGFTWETIKMAHEFGAKRSTSETTAATDDAGLVEDMGREVTVVPGDVLSLKITTELDLMLANLLASHKL